MLKNLTYLFIPFFFVACAGEGSVKSNPDEVVLTDTLGVESSEPLLTQTDWQESTLENIEIPYQKFNYSNNRGLRFEMETGTLVEIPAKAFVDKNGTEVSDGISVMYREFHSISDIVLSGIKMKYDDGRGEAGDFESAGMFEIRAFQGSNELQLNKNKTINVELASYKSGDFSSYKMNETTNNWELIEQKDAKENRRKKEKLANLDALDEELKQECFVQPKVYTEDMEVFDLNYDFQRFREMEFVNEAMWICLGTQDEKNELRQSLTGFNDMDLMPADSCDQYTLTVWKKVSDGSITNKKSFRIQPVWSKNALKRVKKDYNKRSNELRKLADERNVVEREADLIRSFKLKGMGVYNCDRVIDNLKFVLISLAVIFKDKIKSFFYITNNGQVAIKYYDVNQPNFKFNPNSSNSIIAILPQNKIGIVSEKAFQTAYDNARKSGETEMKFELELISDDVPVKNKAEFEKHVARF